MWLRYAIFALIMSYLTGCPADDSKGQRYAISGTIQVSGQASGQAAQPLSAVTMPAIPTEEIHSGRYTSKELTQGYLDDQLFFYLGRSGRRESCRTNKKVFRILIEQHILVASVDFRGNCHGLIRLKRAGISTIAAKNSLVNALRSQQLDAAKLSLDYIMRGQSTPNDPAWLQQSWYLEQIGMPNIWEMPNGNNPVVVAIVDNGYRDAIEDMDENQVLQGIDLVGEDRIAIGPENLGGEYHGAFIQSQLFATTNNQVGLAGIAHPEIQALPIRVLDDQKLGALSTVIDGIVWALGGNIAGYDSNAFPADVVNLSVNNSKPGLEPSETRPADPASGKAIFEDIMLDYGDGSRSGDPLFVCAAGNQADDASFYAPGNVSRCLTVTATNATGNLAGAYANYGSVVKLAAPGGTSSRQLLGYGANTNPISQIGTSFAAPFVTGIAARMLSIDSTLTPNEVEGALLIHARAQDALCDLLSLASGLCSFGRLDGFAPIYELNAALQNVPWLSVSSTNIHFDKGQNQAAFVVENVGQVRADVQVEFEGESADKFTLVNAAEGPFEIEPGETASFEIELDRGGQQVGVAQLVFQGDNIAGTKSILLDFNDLELDFEKRISRVQVQAYIKVEDTENDINNLNLIPVGAPVLTDRDREYQYRLEGLEQGSYFIQAFGDTNQDGLFDSRDAYGQYPFILGAEPVILTVTDREGIDFAIFGGVDVDQFGDVGAACRVDEQCIANDVALCLDRLVGQQTSQVWRGGYCSQECSRDAQCGSRGRCVTLEQVSSITDVSPGGYCLRRCAEDSDCLRDGYHCFALDSTSGVCEPEQL